MNTAVLWIAIVSASWSLPCISFGFCMLFFRNFCSVKSPFARARASRPSRAAPPSRVIYAARAARSNIAAAAFLRGSIAAR